MTWRLKVRGLIFASGMLAALSLASGAQWVDWVNQWVDRLF
jgi:hypothetical protein